jgi:2-aminoadipate transaminase
MERAFPPGVRWTRPKGGLFLWITLPESIDATALLEKAIANKVAFVPGASFYPDGNIGHGGRHTCRLNFSNARPEQIRLGIGRLGEVLTAELERLEPNGLRILE